VVGHAVGWPFPRGGSQRVADALAAKLRELGGEIRTSSTVESLPVADLVVADVVPRELLRLARGRLPERYARRLRSYRHGPGAFKLDWALDGPIPWRAAECRRAGTVHLGGSLDEISASEWGAWRGRPGERPFVLLAQTSLFDPMRAPAGKHTAWAYCHVSNGSCEDMTERVEAQVERFAPGFRDLVLARHAMGPAELEARNRNLVLAAATFASVRSANRAARVAERSLLAGLRPLLVPSKLDDPPQKVGFADDKWVVAEGGRGVAEVGDSAIYLVIPLRNVGAGIAVLHGWNFIPELRRDDVHAEPEGFTRLTRDLYVPVSDVGFWQGTFRDPGTPEFAAARRAIEARSPLTVDLLYGDHEGGQRMISRYALLPRDDGGWLASAGRHWNVDRGDPR